MTDTPAPTRPDAIDPAWRTAEGIEHARSRRRLAGLLTCLVLAAFLGARLLPTRRETDPDRVWSRAQNAFRAGRWDLARTGLDQLERLREKSPLDWMLEAQLATAEGRFDAAFAAIDQIPDSHPIAAQARLMAGRLHRQLRRLRRAEAQFRHALRLQPDLVEARKELIYILGIQSRRREIDAEFQALARSTTLSHHDLFTWALTHFTHWNPDIAADLDGFIKADPEDRLSRLALADLLLERPEVDAYVLSILEPLPETDLDAQALRINLAFNLGRFDEAEAMLAKLEGTHPRIARIRGGLALRRHKIDEAIGHFEMARSAEPYDRVSPMLLAQALQLRGDRRRAVDLLARVERLNRIYNLVIRVKSPQRQNQRSDLAELGEACEQAGLLDEARGWYTLSITMDPLDAESQRALARLGPAASVNR